LYREWLETDKILSEIEFSENKVSIKNIRNFNHISLEKYEKNYYDSEFDLEKIDSIYYIVEPFSDYD